MEVGGMEKDVACGYRATVVAPHLSMSNEIGCKVSGGGSLNGRDYLPFTAG